MSETIRVQFIHGLEGSPQGNKARALASAFDALTPAMDTRDFEACVRLQAQCLDSHGTQVLVGSSYGGAVALALLQRGIWRGPALLLAQAGLRCGLRAELTPVAPVWIVHGRRDDVIDPEDSRRLAAACDDATLVRLIEVDDDHSLASCVSGGELVRWVRDLATSGLKPPAAP